MEHFDLIVIGSGPAGHGAAIQGAKLGKRVAVIERSQGVGGSSVRTGSIPSKALREAVLYLTGLRQREIYGVDYVVKPDLAVQDLIRRCERVIVDEREVIRSQFRRNLVTLVEGEATFVDDGRVRVTHQGGQVSELSADRFVIATGSVPAHSPQVPTNGRTIIDSDGIFALPAIPRTMTVVGAGPVGMEYACIFAALGTEVTVVDQRQRILEFVDGEILEALLYQMRQEGVIFRFGESVTKVDAEDSRVVAHTSQRKRIASDVVLYTVGRRGATDRLGLDRVGVKTDPRGRIPVDEVYRTSAPGIYAVGDVVGFPALASTSMEQGRIAARHAFGVPLETLPSLFPYGLYTIPEVSMVGHPEEVLTAEGVPYEVGIARYRETARGQIIGDRAGMLKLLVHLDTRKLLGVHVIGEGATELVHIGQVLIGLGGDVDYLVNNTFNYPTLAECYRIAALDAVNKLG